MITCHVNIMSHVSHHQGWVACKIGLRIHTHSTFMERSGVFRTTQFAYRKGLGTCDTLL